MLVVQTYRISCQGNKDFARETYLLPYVSLVFGFPKPCAVAIELLTMINDSTHLFLILYCTIH